MCIRTRRERRGVCACVCVNMIALHAWEFHLCAVLLPHLSYYLTFVHIHRIVSKGSPHKEGTRVPKNPIHKSHIQKVIASSNLRKFDIIFKEHISDDWQSAFILVEDPTQSIHVFILHRRHTPQPHHIHCMHNDTTPSIEQAERDREWQRNTEKKKR